jgi:hypothetical protein
MKKTLRILFLTTLLMGQLITSYADRGAGKKRSKVVLNIKMPTTFTKSLDFNLKNGMKYTGSFLSPLATNKTTTFSPFKFNTIITYKKGNSIYIVPYKQKVFVADSRQGYAGTKLIIKMR